MDKIAPYIQKADEFLGKFPLLAKAEKATQVPKLYLALSAWILVSASLLLNFLAGLTSNLLAMAYPAYSTLEAIHKQDLAKLKLWSLYFLLLSGVTLLETGDFLPSLIPFYHVIKTAAFVYLYTPHYFVCLIDMLLLNLQY
jgi:hypothetical protein